MKAFLPLMILLLSGCGSVDLAGNPYTATTAHQGTNPPPITPPAPPTPPPPPPPAPPPLNPAGIWDVSGTVNGNQVSEVALVANRMYLSLAATDEFGCRHIAGGNYTVNGDTFTGTGVTAILEGNCTDPDYFTWTLSGTVNGSELNLSFDDGGRLVPTLGATLDPLYDLYGSSLATLTGNWEDAGNVLTVNPDGTFFEQQGNGCVVTGAYTLIDPAHNLYGVSFVFDSATCGSSGIAGIQFTGLAYLTPNTSAGWYHLLEDASGVNANGTLVVVFDSLTPYFTPPTAGP